jgi:hypothetical protein
MTRKIPTRKQIEKALQEKVWDFGNSILYNLCKNNFRHNANDKIIAKVLFIGRIYAAAVERRKNKTTDINDNFYINTVAPTFRKSELDQRLSKLRSFKLVTFGNIKSVLQTHHYLTSVLQRITDLEKRSFSSKYLHFHLPEMFYIYDSRAVSALRLFRNQVPNDLKWILELENIDYDYAKFYCKCFDLKRQILEVYNIDLTNRQLDNVLISNANKLIIEKKKR